MGEVSDDDRDLLMGLADDARGQAGGLSRDDQQRLGELALAAWSEVETLRADARDLVRIVRAVAALQLAGRMDDAIAYALDQATEGEHLLVDDEGKTIMRWPEQNLGEVAAQLEAAAGWPQPDQ